MVTVRAAAVRRAGETERLASRAWKALERCELCELRCGVNRRTGERGPCHLGDATSVFRCYVSFGEELSLSPALMVYLGGCNFRCRFCTQAPRCFVPDDGPELTSREVVEWIESSAPAVRWINFVGGEPSLHPHTLLELRQRVTATAPWLLNTNGYFTSECRELIDRLFDLYLVDFKFGNDLCADRLASLPRYVQELQRNLCDVYATGADRLVVRHLLMPGHERCCLEPVVEWVAVHLPGVRFHLMSSYVPNYLALQQTELSRTVPTEVAAEAERYCRRLGLHLIE